jgi:FHS family L-fucose permease-like MFS transporter
MSVSIPSNAVKTGSGSAGSVSGSGKHHLFLAGQLVPFILVTFLFFLWGIPNNLNDVLIRQFMKSFSISRFQAGLVQSAFYMGYFLLAMQLSLRALRDC